MRGKNSSLIFRIISLILIIFGFLIFLYPYIQKVSNLNKENDIIVKYEENIEKLSNEDKEEILEEQIRYNQSLYENELFNISLDNLNGDNIKDNVLGYIIIPKINVKLPIYDGSGKNILTKGIGHLENTSLPVGGKSTHSVLVGHTGLAYADMFDNLNDLNIGDIFYIRTLDTLLKYKVNDKNIVLPDNTDVLKIQEDEDLVTLVTCTPKHKNTHRLLVTGTRTNLEKDEENKKIISENLTKKKAVTQVIEKNNFLKYIIIVFFVFILIIIFRF